MAKLTRKTQKIFAGNADNDQITAFGTAKTSSPTYTTDIDAIQTTAFTQGWTPSLMSDLAPYLQDSNALWYAITRQLAYIYQQGIPEWDSNTTYYIGSKVSDGSKIYVSKTDNNIGNALTETTYWDVYDLNIASSLNSKLNIDLSNATSTTKTTIINLGMPDYSAGVTSITSGFTAPANGVLYMCINWNEAGAYVYINGNPTVYYHDYEGEGGLLSTPVTIYMSKDDVMTWGGTIRAAYFYPLKGVN